MQHKTAFDNDRLFIEMTLGTVLERYVLEQHSIIKVDLSQTNVVDVYIGILGKGKS